MTEYVKLLILLLPLVGLLIGFAVIVRRCVTRCDHGVEWERACEGCARCEEV